ncbi:unnamed protein product [Effrenium voratum]|nr:unnamed protein product [Effrenium voratum]
MASAPELAKYHAAINAHGRKKQWAKALELLQGLDARLRANIVTYNAVINTVKRGPWTLAAQLCAELQARHLTADGITRSSAVAALRGRSSGRWQAACFLLSGVDGIQKDAIICGSALSVCESYWQSASFLLALMRRNALRLDEFIGSGAINACQKGGQWQRSLGVLEEFHVQRVGNVVMYNAAISACERGAHWQLALALLVQAEMESIQLDTITYNACVSACEKASRWPQALALLRRAIRRRLFDVVTFSATVSACANGRWQAALDLLQTCSEHNVQPDTIMHNAAISACERGGEWQLAMAVWQQMDEETIITFNALISACEKGAQWQMALSVLNHAKESRVRPDVTSFNASISACEKGTQWVPAIRLLVEMMQMSLQADVVTYSSLISACKQQWPLALHFFAEMEQTRSDQDGIAYISAINAVGSHWPALVLVRELAASGLPVDADAYGLMLQVCQRAGASRMAQSLLAELMQSATQSVICANWHQGVTHLALLSRSGHCRPESPEGEAMQKLCERPVELLLQPCDVSKRPEVDAAIAAMQGVQDLPCGGVVHAAGVLEDHTIAHMESGHLLPVFSPKVDGAVNLHEAFAKSSLAHFLMFSSVAALMGSPGQGNYAAANSFLDAFALHRQAKGLPALSLQWGPWADVGMAARGGVGGPGFWAPKVAPSDALQADGRGGWAGGAG